MNPTEKQALDPAYLTLLLRINWVVCTLASAVLSVPYFVVTDQPYWLVLAIFAGFWAVLVWLTRRYTRAWFARHRHWLTELGLYIERGVFWRTTVLVPRNRLQHIDITHGPLERRAGLAKLVLHTAGTRNASVTVPGLREDDAVSLRAELLETVDDDAV